MSVVLAYADDRTAIIASDGRVSNILGNVISEEYSKVRKIGMNSIIGYAGHALPCNDIANRITDTKTTKLTQDARVEDISDCIQKHLLSYPDGLNIGFIICGIDKSGKMRAEIVSLGQSSIIYHPDRKNPFFCGMYPKDISPDECVFEKQLLRKKPEEAMRETIKICAGLSQTVNQNVFLEHFQVYQLQD